MEAIGAITGILSGKPQKSYLAKHLRGYIQLQVFHCNPESSAFTIEEWNNHVSSSLSFPYSS